MHTFYRRYGKRLLDIILGILGCIPACPVMLIVIIAMFFFDRGTIFFVQERAGKRDANGNPTTFRMHKFRTMKMNTPHDVPTDQFEHADQYITPLGKFLRKSSLDELPQFINVFKGEMSVVGPRPHMLKHTKDYSAIIDKYMVRHFIKPGLTGWAQVNGYRGETKELWQMEKRVEYDVWYIENWNFMLDMKIIFLTLIGIFKGDKNAF